MVMPVVGRPPDRSALQGGAAAYRADELEDPGCPEAPVGEIPMVEGGDEEHAREVEKNGASHGDPADADPEDSKAAGMDSQVGDAVNPVDLEGLRIVETGFSGSSPGSFGRQARLFLFALGSHLFTWSSQVDYANAKPIIYRVWSIEFSGD
jgi:hypothetical protein